MSYKEGFRKRVSHAETNKNHFPYLTFELHILLRTILTAILDVFWAKTEIFCCKSSSFCCQSGDTIHKSQTF